MTYTGTVRLSCWNHFIIVSDTIIHTLIESVSCISHQTKRVIFWRFSGAIGGIIARLLEKESTKKQGRTFFACACRPPQEKGVELNCDGLRASIILCLHSSSFKGSRCAWEAAIPTKKNKKTRFNAAQLNLNFITSNLTFAVPPMNVRYFIQSGWWRRPR